MYKIKRKHLKAFLILFIIFYLILLYYNNLLLSPSLNSYDNDLLNKISIDYPHIEEINQFEPKALNETTQINNLHKFEFNYKYNDYNLEIQVDIKIIHNQRKKYETVLSENRSKIKQIGNCQRQLVKHDYLILEYTEVFNKPKFCNFTSQQIFNSDIEQCSHNNCKYSCDKVNSLKEADALIFHLRDLESELKYKYNNEFDKWLQMTEQLPFKTVELKLLNNPNQIWILWNDESTPVDKNFNKISNLFNWTLSFKTDAEIYEGSYGYFKQNEQNITNLEFYNKKKDIYLNDFQKRKNAILWFVSNCKSTYRLEIALEISKYYPVYIYGKCDLLSSIKSDKYPHLNYISSNDLVCQRGSNCELDKLKTFKYYFAFENINCKDYVTEKVWRSLNNNLIPILLQPKRDSYIRYLIPEKSIIHLNDFNDNIQLLVGYLNKIDSNFNLYFEHLKWTNIYLKTIDNIKYTEPHRMCQLCHKLNTFKSNVYYKLLADFFSQDCQIIKHSKYAKLKIW